MLIRLFIKDSDNVTDRNVREKYTILAGGCGLVCNTLLFALKLFIGMAMNSIAIMGDAFNNLSDTGSCFVAIIGAKLSNRKPDKEHPFGHGRIEYLSSLIVSFLIMLVGFELIKTSVNKLRNPEPLAVSPVLMIILCVSVLVKLWMYFSYRYMGKRIGSVVLEANSRDSLNDVISTSAVIAATWIGALTKLPADGVIGIAVSLMIMYSGFGIAKETITLLLGKPAEPSVVENIERIISEPTEIVGIHDLVIHDYGPGRNFASVHAEIPDDSDIVKAHEIIDRLEKQVKSQLGIELVIHTDPISVNCEQTIQLRKIVEDILSEENDDFSVHDFRITNGVENVNLIFDMVVPFGTKAEKIRELSDKIRSGIRTAQPNVSTVINIDNKYT